MTMTINKAMKRLKKLKNTASTLASKIKSHNKLLRDVQPLYKVKDLIQEYHFVIKEIIDLKFRIMKANVDNGMYLKVLLAGEFKGLKQVLSSVDTSEGPEFNYSGGEVIYEAQFNELHMEELTDDLSTQIEELLESLDVFNAKTEI